MPYPGRCVFFSFNSVRLGAQAADAGTSGTLYFDGFESRRLSYMGVPSGLITLSPPMALSNVAQNKTASQSSTLVHACNPVAAKAVDGNTSGVFSDCSITSTNSQAQAWWKVDLGQLYAIGSIELWNRTDCCSDRLSNFKVYVSKDGVAWTEVYYKSGQAGTQTVINTNRIGRYVKVQLLGTNYLALAEVKVWGSPLATPSPEPTAEASWSDAAYAFFAWGTA